MLTFLETALERSYKNAVYMTYVHLKITRAYLGPLSYASQQGLDMI